MRHNRPVPRPRKSARRPLGAHALGALAALLGLLIPAVTARAAGEEGSPGPAVAPAVVFSAARAQCTAPAPAAGATVATRWLLDGAPIPGANGPSYVPPRVDDGHALSCAQSVSEASGSTQTFTSAARIVHEQPPAPAWPIGPAAGSCAAPVCMQEGAGPVATGEAYGHAGAWWGAEQVRCVSAPWTSIVGDSQTAAVRSFAEAHAVRLVLQRLDPSGPVAIAAQELTELATAGDALDGAGGPFAGTVVTAYGAAPFAAGELWSRVFAAAVGRPDWFAPQGGLLVYALSAGAPRSFQLTYTLGPDELGARLRCVASAADGPAAAPTEASFASSDYTVGASPICRPRRLAAFTSPQPALISVGDPRCLAAPSALPALGAGLQAISVKRDRIALAVACSLHGGCEGELSLTAGRRLASVAVRVRSGAERVVGLSLGRAAVRAIARAGHAGLAATVRLARRGEVRTLAVARLIGR